MICRAIFTEKDQYEGKLLNVQNSFLVPMAVRSKPSFCGLSSVGIELSNPTGGMDVCCFDCCVLSDRGLCGGLITRLGIPSDCGVCVCDRQASIKRRNWHNGTGGPWKGRKLCRYSIWFVRHYLYKKYSPILTDWVNTDFVKDGALCWCYWHRALTERTIRVFSIFCSQAAGCSCCVTSVILVAVLPAEDPE